MKPENVNPSNFEVKSILYNNTRFSIAYGIWLESGETSLAMRWNGEDNSPGYPKTFGHPVWFLLDTSLKKGILQMLVGEKETDKAALLKAIEAEM